MVFMLVKNASDNLSVTWQWWTQEQMILHYLSRSWISATWSTSAKLAVLWVRIAWTPGMLGIINIQVKGIIVVSSAVLYSTLVWREEVKMSSVVKVQILFTLWISLPSPLYNYPCIINTNLALVLYFFLLSRSGFVCPSQTMRPHPYNLRVMWRFLKLF